jgi:membrane protease YdiL (CAAX protease family)
MNAPTLPTPRRGDLGAVLFGLLFPALGTWLYFVVLKDSPKAIQHVAYAAEKGIQFGFPVVWVLWVRRQWPSWPARPWRGVGLGLAFGLAVAVVMLLLFYGWLMPAGHLSGAEAMIRKKLAGFGLSNLGRYVAFAAAYSLIHSLAEEYYWRWFVFGQLRRLIPPWWAIGVSALGFMAHHVLVLGLFFGWLAPATWCFSLAVALGGAFWAWLYHHSGSLMGPWLSHLLVDAAIFTVGYQFACGLPGR